MSWVTELTKVLNSIDDVMYTYILTGILLLASIYFSVRTKFAQVRLFPDSVKILMEKGKNKGTSSLQALMISTAARVGTGCIAGVATAIHIGGAGTVFWMWLVAFISSSLTFIECTLAQMYKVRGKDGEFRGGPAYYIEQVLHKRWYGVLFSVLLVICYAYSLNSFQSHMITESVMEYIPDSMKQHGPLIVGIILAVITLCVIFGGIKRIGFVSSYIVPIMALGYLGIGIAIIVMNAGRLPKVMSDIFTGAFSFKAISTGIAGAALIEGVKKGLLSHESGMGSAANIAAAADVSHPAKQGASQVFSVFITTFIVCTTTAFIVLLSGVDFSTLENVTLVQESLKFQVGGIGNLFLTVAVFFFAFSSIVGNYSYAESNVLFIKDSKKVLNIFRLTCVAIIVVGAIAPSEAVWKVLDIFMAFMALSNIIAILLIGNRAVKCLDDYTKQKKAEKDPVFKASNIGLDDMEAW